MDWWNRLDDSWKSIFYYNYLLKRAPDLIRETVWKNKEMVTAGEDGLSGIVNLDLLENNFPFPIYFVVLEALVSVELFDISPIYFWKYEFEGCQYKIYWNFDPKSSDSISELRQMESIFLYKQDNDISKQPKLEITSFRDLVRLRELHLHISHCHHLQDILLLNLPSLKKINFYAGINEHSYQSTSKEEGILNSMRGKTRVELVLKCYLDF
jgi:hypothetical protein